MSLNTYDSSSGTLTNIASSSRIWTGTKAEWQALVSAGTAPRNVLVAITDDEDDFPVGDTDISEIGDGTITGAIAYLSQNGGGTPVLDYANPLHTFSSGNLTYTTIKKCWLVGCINSSGSAVTATIDGTRIFNSASSGASGAYFLPLNPGSTVTINAAMSALSIYQEA